GIRSVLRRAPLSDEAVSPAGGIHVTSNHVATGIDTEHPSGSCSGEIDATKFCAVELKAMEPAGAVSINAHGDASRVDVPARSRRGAGHLERLKSAAIDEVAL